MPKLTVFIAAAILTAFGIAGSALVGFSHLLTEDKIAENERLALLRDIAKLVPQESINNDMLSDVIEISAPNNLGASVTKVYRGRKDGEPIVVVLSPVIANGYGGDIKLIVAIKKDGELGGVRVLSHKETPGLGDKIEENRSNWILGFAGKSLDNPKQKDWKVKKDGGEFDQFTGATITPRGIVEAVNKALVYHQAQSDALYVSLDPTPVANEVTEETDGND